jgi:hypothetical protein
MRKGEAYDQICVGPSHFTNGVQNSETWLHNAIWELRILRALEPGEIYLWALNGLSEQLTMVMQRLSTTLP